MSEKTYNPCNKNAQQCVKNVLKYLSDITGEQVITGQHTQTMKMEEYNHIKDVTGKEPALLGFELLSYSPNINYTDTDEECMTEVMENYGTLKRAYEWADKKGLITMCWHWFSPLGGKSKSFYTRNTDFDTKKAVQEGTAESIALIRDIDTLAGMLRPFCDKEIPILFRPIHESEGDWFWWGAYGKDTYIKLYKLIYHRMTDIHGLNNLIWVWNSTVKETYPGDEYVDVISRDMYPPAHEHTSQSEMYNALVSLVEAQKPVIIGETGTLPDVEAIVKEKVGWSAYMTWSKVFCLTEEFTAKEHLIKTYNSPAAVTLDKLPELY